MKKVSLVAALTLSTMLCACGGGGGGGYGNVPTTTLPGVTQPDKPSNNPTTQDLENYHNTEVSGQAPRIISDKNLDKYNAYANEIRQEIEEDSGAQRIRTMSLVSTYAGANDDPLKNVCKSDNDCNRALFENMIRVLVEHDLTNAGSKEVREALLLAGFTKQDLAGMWDDINQLKNFLKDYQGDIQKKLDEFFGKFDTVTIENSKLKLVEQDETGGKDAFINLELSTSGDDVGKIKYIRISNNNINYTLNRQGDANTFTGTNTLYRYGINCPRFTGIFIESSTPLSGKALVEALTKHINEVVLPSGVLSPSSTEEGAKSAEEYAKELIAALGAGDTSSWPLGDMEDSDDIKLFQTTHTKDETVKYESYGNKDGLKLSYSDFGILSIEGTDSFETGTKNNIKETKAFAGGYEEKKIASKEINQNMTFTGKAVGAVNYIRGANQSSDLEASKSLVLNGDAKLSFDASNGNQNLKATFNNWYDVDATLDSNGKGDITFSNGNRIKDNDFKFHEKINDYETGRNGFGAADYKNDYTVEDFTTSREIDTDIKTGHSEPTYGAMDVGYYGDAGVPSEATGYLYYTEGFGWTDTAGNEVGDRLYLNMGFGAKRD